MRILLTLLLSYCFIIPIHANSFPEFVNFSKDEETFHLELTGSIARKKFFIKIYNVASYLDRKAAKDDLFQAIMSDANAKQLIVKWTHDASLARVRKGYLSSFKEELSKSEFTEIEIEIAKYLSFFKSDIRNGDEHILRWLPGGYIESIINGEVVGSIKNSRFARALWGIWFSADSNANGKGLLHISGLSSKNR